MRIVFEQNEVSFSELIKRVLQGEEITIVSNGKAIAKLIPVRKKRTAGIFKEKIKFDEDITEPLPDNIVEEFYESVHSSV